MSLNFAINDHILDCAYQNDPRLKKFREAEKQKKMELKQAKEKAEKEKEMVKSVHPCCLTKCKNKIHSKQVLFRVLSRSIFEGPFGINPFHATDLLTPPENIRKPEVSDIKWVNGI